MTEEQEHLEQLIKHPGWLRFLEYAKYTWGPAGYGRQLKLAVVKAQLDKADVSAAVAAVDKANDEVNALLTWPVSRLKALDVPKPEDLALQRGGS